MASPLDGLFGGGSFAPGGGFGGADFGNRLDALFLAMASTPPGSGTIPLLQATQLETQIGQQQAQRNALAAALQMYGVDPKMAQAAAWNPTAAQMILQQQQLKNGQSVANGALATEPKLDTPAPQAPPAPQIRPSANTPPIPAVPNISLAQTANANPTDAASPIPSAGFISAAQDGQPSELTAPPPLTIPGSVAPVAGPQPQSKADAALMVNAQNRQPVPPQANSSAAVQAYYQKLRAHWMPYLQYEGKAGLEGVVALAKEKLGLADKYLGPDSNPQLQADIAGAKKGATFPYDAAIESLRYGARPITVGPNQTVTTGAQVNPYLNAIMGRVASQLGVPVNAPSTQNPQPNDSSSLQQQYTPHLIQNPDGSFGSSVTPAQEAMQHNLAEGLKEAQKQANAANNVQYRLNLIEHDLDKLNENPGWFSSGTGGATRNEIAKTINSYALAAGVDQKDLPFPGDKVASFESLNKEATQLGFTLARTLGAREAMQVVEQSIKANPTIANTPQGAKLVLNSLRMAAQSNKDYYNFITQYMNRHGGQLIGADQEFYHQFPPSAYSSATLASANAPGHVRALIANASNPRFINDFNAKYGNGAAQVILRAYNVQ